MISLRGSLLLVAALALLTPALSEEVKPDFAVATKSVDASVLLDPQLKADPALAADCLAEGKTWAEKYRADADRERKQSPDMFRDGAWTVERKYDLRSVVKEHYVSVVRTDYTNTGGVHPNSDVDTILWDKTAAKRISIRPFFTETADDGPTMKALRQAVVAALKTEKLKRDIPEAPGDDWFKVIEPKLTKIGAVTLAPSTEPGKSSGLTFHYPPDAIGPHAEGDYVGFVPWEKLKPYLTPEGAAIFGGARPRNDED
ncbi:MAG TPA: hypothetical protein VGC77_05305 [Rhodopseudomonas sp.]|uniref:DUF3298 and DUF4163 domain-containing protein n=1 Tax=Rhodopseudomonas sp. TaxID=1078 RepID=UPI002EDAC8C8